MKYLICYNLPDPVARYHDDVVADVSRRFGTQQLNQRIDPHITLKAPFDADQGQIEGVEDVVADVAATAKPSTLSIHGFGHFKERIIYMDVEPSQEADGLIQHLINMLEERLPWLPFHYYDRYKDLHATIVKRDGSDRFQDIWRYVTETYDPSFEIELDNITILVNRDRRWYTHKKFSVRRGTDHSSV